MSDVQCSVFPSIAREVQSYFTGPLTRFIGPTDCARRFPVVP
jgi:hypothetical protein